MIRSRVHLFLTLLSAGVLLCSTLAGQAATSVYVTPDGGLYAVAVPGPDTAENALEALSSPPYAAPDGRALNSAILPGTHLLSLQISDDRAVVDFTRDIIGDGLDEARLEAIHTQVRFTLEINGGPASVSILAAGKDLYEHLPPLNPVPANTQGRPPVRLAAGTLAGKIITLSPGHGLKWSGSSWTTDRPVYCAPLNQEDYHNLEMGIYLETHLLEAGATMKTNRCTNKSYGNHAIGEPWWHMGPSAWLQHKGYPCSVYANYTGDCTLGTGASEATDNIRARGLASNYDGVDIHVAIHTNGYKGDCVGSGCPSGTGTYYDSSSSHAAWGAVSLDLATRIQNAVISAVRTQYPDSTWKDRGTPDFAGSNSETRVPQRAAALIEHGFHDTCDKDAIYLRDNFFKSLSMWAMYQGICDYFGVATTWGMYSSELISHDIPTSLKAGQTVQAHITMRNHGVLWNSDRQFRLGAVGESDPLSAATRVQVASEVAPGNSVTFTLTLTAPSRPGTYVTDWQMVRDGYTWFGDVVRQFVVVEAVDSVPPEIAFVTVTPNMAAPGDSLLVEVDATDDRSLASVTVEGLPMSHVSDRIWSRTISAAAGLGEHPLAVTATDTSGNTTPASGAYTVASILWASSQSLNQDDIIALLAGQYLFSTWGRVTSVTVDGFALQGASGETVQVRAPGHTFGQGHFVAARGRWDGNATPPALICQPQHVRRLD